ncbi:hypothetical protein CsSME_00015806 [Camellia sinensis var. sinensis]
MIFILTFNLVVVSGLCTDKVMELARERLSNIGMGFAVCVFTNMLIFSIWASDELHYSIASKFETLACYIEGYLEEYFRLVNEKENHSNTSFASCKSMLHSKSSEESLANFARWEPWHGKFGLSYPWDKYLQIGDVLRELATTIVSLKECLQSHRQPSSALRQSIREPCEVVGSSLACRPKAFMAPKLQSMKQELSLVTYSKLGAAENGEGLAMASLVFLLKKMTTLFLLE